MENASLQKMMNSISAAGGGFSIVLLKEMLNPSKIE